MRYAPFIFILVFSLAGALRCDTSSGGDPSPDIIGHISMVIALPTEPRTGLVIIEGPRREETLYDRASVIVSMATVIIDKTGAGERIAAFGFLTAGQKVEALFTGPVAESYPVQATASLITVLESAFFETSCEKDDDCALINSSYGYNCCWIGACDLVDYSQKQWISVNADWFTGKQEEVCPASGQCGPAPGCPVQVIDDSNVARCIENVCKKVKPAS